MDENGSIESLTLEINARSESAEKAVDKLISTLERLQNRTANLGLGNIGTQLNGIRRAAAGFGDKEAAGLERILGALDKLQNVSTIKISSSIANQLTNIATAAGNINDTDFSGVERLGKALSGLAGVGQVNIGSALNQLNRIPKIAENLKNIDLADFAARIREITDALRPLAEEMEKVSKGFSAFPDKLQRVLRETEKIPQANKRAADSFGLLAAKVTAGWLAMKKLLSGILSLVRKSNDFIESQNLFNVAMGQYASEAREHAESVSDALGIDPAEWMQNQGIFMTLSTGFGIAGDSAAEMSKNLTQLGYDLSSFYNISSSDAFQKLQSGLSGEIEPLRRLGFDLSQAKLQQIAYSQGIHKNVSEMTQAEKASLRYYAIMTQVTQAQGDMARTIDQPANQLRILRAKTEEAARALGNLLLPIVKVVVPWLIAGAEAVTKFANGLALILGIEGSGDDSFDFSNIIQGAQGQEDAWTGASNAAEEYKRMLLGIDELNVLNGKGGSGLGSGGGYGGGYGGGAGGNMDIPGYSDYLDKLMKGEKEDASGVSNLLLTIRDVFVDWEDLNAEQVAQKILTGFGGLLGAVAGFSVGGLKGGVLGLAVGTVLSLLLSNVIFDHDGTLSGTELLQSLLPILGGIAGFVISGTPVGGLIGFAIGAALSLLIENFAIDGETGQLSSGFGNNMKDLIRKVFAGAGIGFILGGPGGAMIGAAIGTVVSMTLSSLGWNGEASPNADLIRKLLPFLGAAGGGLIGFAIGGPAGAALGAAIGVGLGFIVKSVDWEQVQEKISSLVDLIEERFSTAKTLVSMIFGDMGQSVEPKFNKPAIGSVGSFVQNFISTIQSVGSGVGNAFGNAASAVGTGFVDPAKMKLNEFSDAVANTASKNVDVLTESFSVAGTTALEQYTVPVTEGLTQLSATIEEKSAANAETLTNSFAGAGTAVDERFIVPTQEKLNTFFLWMDENMVLNSGKMTESFVAAGLGIQEQFILPLQENFMLLFTTMNENFAVNSTMIIESYAAAFAGVNAGYIAPMNQAFAAMFAEQKAGWAQNKADIIASFNQAKTGILSGFVTPVRTQTISMCQQMQSQFRMIQSVAISSANAAAAGMRSAFSGLASWFSSAVYSPIVSMLSSLSSQIRSVSSYSVSRSRNYNPSDPFNNWPGGIKLYASGGFPDVGQLFVAREQGPELVGRIGNQSAVANNNQIIDGIRQGVYEAMMASNSGGRNGDINLYVSGKQLMTAVAEEARRETVRTGVNPLTQGG